MNSNAESQQTSQGTSLETSNRLTFLRKSPSDESYPVLKQSKFYLNQMTKQTLKPKSFKKLSGGPLPTLHEREESKIHEIGEPRETFESKINPSKKFPCFAVYNPIGIGSDLLDGKLYLVTDMLSCNRFNSSRNKNCSAACTGSSVPDMKIDVPKNNSRKRRTILTRSAQPRNLSKVTFTSDKYYCIPGIEDLDANTDDYGHCFVENLEVGHLDYGKIVFENIVDVAGFNVDSAIKFEHKRVRIYPNRLVVPRPGTELNQPAIVTLHDYWPNDQSKLEKTLSLQDPVFISNYVDSLIKQCEKYGLKFIAFNKLNADFTFKVNVSGRSIYNSQGRRSILLLLEHFENSIQFRSYTGILMDLPGKLQINLMQEHCKEKCSYRTSITCLFGTLNKFS